MATMPVEKGFFVTSGFGSRWGGTHWGTDFGREGGSAGFPVFAVKSGMVNRASVADGFGMWVTIDHPAEVGGGTSVYGHIVPEVSVGQQVAEGQRIGHINPNRATNGGVDAHLHFEFHRSVWAPPGGDRLDPMTTVLKNAAWPGNDGGAPARSSTIFGIDISEHQDGMSLVQAAREGLDFCIIRTTDGTYRDRTYRSHVDDARNTDMALSAYHYLRNPSEGTTVKQQVDASLEVMGPNHRLPVWIDVETEAGLHVDHIRECKRLYEAAGIRVLGVYSYVPYWEGRVAPSEPDSHEFGLFWKADYNDNPDAPPARAYPGDNHEDWDYPLGNQKPIIWQFTSKGDVAGFGDVDVNAFRGSKEELKAIFDGKQPEEEITVSQADRIIQELKTYVDMRITEPIGSDVKDIRQQLTGGRDKGEYPGWKQLGQDKRGNNLTAVDGLAALRQDIARLRQEIQEIKKGL